MKTHTPVHRDKCTGRIVFFVSVSLSYQDVL